jgi:hypothetical protein
MFSEAGKYGLSLTTANQYLTQLSPQALDAMRENVGTSIFFAVGQKTAKTVKSLVSPDYTADNLEQLDRFKAVVKMQVTGQTQPAFTMITERAIDPPPGANQQYEKIKNQSADLFGRPAQVIDAEIRARYQTQDKTQPVTESTEAELPDELAS